MNSQFQNWGDLRVFLAVLRCGSTLAAGKSIGMAQPTVARRIDALEHVLQVTLFERDTRGFHPTVEAERLRPLAESVEAAAMAFAKEADAYGRLDSRPIRLTAPNTNFSDNLTRTLDEFIALHPGTRFEFVATTDVVDLVAGEADVAIRFAREIVDERLIGCKMTEVTSSLYAAKSYAAQHGLPSSGDDLAGHSLITYSSDILARDFNAWLTPRIDPAQIISRCSDPASMIVAVRAGFGIGMVPTSLAEEDGTLIRCFPPPEGTSTPCWLVIGPDAWRRPIVKKFAKFFPPRFRSYIRAKPTDSGPPG